MTIRVHIDRLVLDGLPLDRRDAAAVQAAVVAELSRLIESSEFPAGLRTGGAVDRLSGGNIAVEARSRPDGIGSEIAGSIHRSIGL